MIEKTNSLIMLTQNLILSISNSENVVAINLKSFHFSFCENCRD